MKVELDARSLAAQMTNGLIGTPVEIRLDWDCIDLVVYTPDPTEPGSATTHQISVALSGGEVALIIRSPLGTAPERRVLHDFRGA